jgi:predicted permease
MRRLRVLGLRLRSLLRRRAVENELERELAFHLEQLTREGLARGLSEAEARRAARRAFGALDLAREGCRDARRMGWLEDLAKDVRYGFRLLARSPAFTITAVVSLALGIGANIAIFSVVEAVLLRSLSVEHPRELVFVRGAGAAGRGLSYRGFERLRAQASAFAGVAAMATDELRLEVDGAPEQVLGQVVSGGYFDTLGVKAAAGRLMTAADESLDPPVAVIGHGYWQRRFGGDRAAIGRTIFFSGRAYTIVGVTTAAFWGLHPGRQVEVFFPITGQGSALADPSGRWMEVVARLRPGTGVEEATAQASTIFRSFVGEQAPGMAAPANLALVPAARGTERLRARFAQPLYLLALAAGTVLLIACANLGNLLLARGAARRRELAIRRATGAGAGRLLRQLLTETLLLFLLGGAAGLLLAHLAIQGLVGFFAGGRTPILLDVRHDWRLLLFAAGLTLAAGVITAWWPALRALRTDPQATMRSGGGTAAGSGRLLVTGQVALSLVLLTGAAIFGRTMINLRAADLGFGGQRVLTMSLDVVGPGQQARQPLWRQILERVRALPGVRAASLSVLTPLSGRNTGAVVAVPGFQPLGEAERLARLNHVSEDYFRTFGIELRRGRAFTTGDSQATSAVAILNEAAAVAYFGGREAIGETLVLGQERRYRVVGIVRNHKHLSVREPTPRQVFIPLWQPFDPISRITLAVASDQPPAALARAVAEQVRALQASTLVSDVIGMDAQIDATLLSERLLSTLATTFGALALILTAVGLFGVLSYAVARRRAELAIRMALGAPPTRIASDVLRQGLVQVGSGVLLGLPFALVLARAAEGSLFGVTAADPTSYALSAAVLLVVAALAAWLPAHRAGSIDPASTLRVGP